MELRGGTRLLVCIVLMLVLCAPMPRAATSFGQAQCAGPLGASEIEATFDSSPATDSLIWVAVGWVHTTDDTITVTVNDSRGNTYVAPAGAKQINAGIGGVQGFYTINAGATGPPMTVFATMTDNSGNPSQINVCAAEIPGVDTASPLDDDNGSEADGVSLLDVGSVTTTVASGMALTALQTGGDRTHTVPAAYTSAHAQVNRFSAAYRVTGAPGGYGATWTWSGGTSGAAGVHMVFKAADGGGGGEPSPGLNRILLQGCC